MPRGPQHLAAKRPNGALLLPYGSTLFFPSSATMSRPSISWRRQVLTAGFAAAQQRLKSSACSNFAQRAHSAIMILPLWALNCRWRRRSIQASAN